MTETVLYSAPGTCARVAAIVLEEIGLPFESRLVRFRKGEHKSGKYRRLNPTGKVPALLIDGVTLTENVAIIQYLARRFPAARVMPEGRSAVEQAHQTADLCFCSATLHPIVSRIRIPHFVAGPDCAKAVWTASCEAMHEYLELVENRLADRSWWYGDEWSAMDAYLYWVLWRIEGANFPIGGFPRYEDHATRMVQRPAVQRALQREAAMAEQLEREGLTWTPPPLE